MLEKNKKINFIHIQVLIFVGLITFFFGSSYQKILAQEYEYAWVLVNETDDRGIEKLEETEKVMSKYENSSINSSINNNGYYVDYEVKQTFVGINSAAEATISTTPLEIKPDTKIPLNLRLRVTNNEGYDGKSGDASATASVKICDENSTPQNFLPPSIGGNPLYENEFNSENGLSLFSSNNTNGYPSYDLVVYGSLPAGTTHGDAVAVCANATLLGVPMGTIYQYRWMPSGSGNVSNLNTKIEVPRDENGDYIDSGVRVSDISGEVYVRRGDASKVEWELLNYDDIIYQGDVIQTKNRNSHCTLSLTDLTVFEMRPRSGLIINTMSEKESAISILTGKVLLNVKKMIKDGSMNIEMSQAVAGIKGTILTAESYGNTSEVNVIEGKVEVKSNNGDLMLLGANEKILIVDGQMKEKEILSGDSDLTSLTDKEIIEKNINKDKGSKVSSFYLLLLLLLSIMFFGYWKLKKK